MPGKPSNIGKFWQELKRRRVIHVITVYATSAFVIIELVNNLVEPLSLPAKLPTIVIIILAVGFPLAVILSWLYDLTSEGVERTKPLSEIKEGEKPTVPNAWKIATYVSFVVIIGLVVLNVMGRGKQFRPGDIQRVLILPFANYTGADSLEYFVEGMHSSLITEMGRISRLHVKGKTTSDVYKNVDKPLHEIAREVNVDAVIETDVLGLGDSINVQHRLISGSSEEEILWIGDYTEEISQILNFYKRVIRQIAGEVNIELTADEESFLAESRTVDREAYDAYLRSYQYWGDLSKESVDKAYEYLSLALEKDPGWAPLHAGMAMVWGIKSQMGFVSPEVAIPNIHLYLQTANDLDPDFADNHFISAGIAVWTDWDWEKGEQEFLKTLAINPSHVMSRIYYAHLLMILQRTDEAIQQGQLAVELDPLNPLILALYSVIMKGAGDYQASLDFIEQALSRDPQHSFTLGQLERAYYNIGEYEKALETFMKGMSNNFPEDDLLAIDAIYKEKGHIAAYTEIIRLIETKHKEGSGTPGDQDEPLGRLSQLYCRVGEYSKALDALEKRYAAHDPNLPYLATNRPGFIELYDSSRFVAILEKMNLPLPKD